MDYFTYQSASRFGKPVAQLTGETVPIDAVADAVGTPCYVYSARTAMEHAFRFSDAFAPIDPLICYAVKACSNIEIIRRLCAPRTRGLSAGAGFGADVVSGLELERAWLAGCPMDKVVFAGVGKSDSEIRAALDGSHSPLRSFAAEHGHPDPSARGPAGVLNTESRSELERIASIAAELGVHARVAVRVNPDVDAGAHQHTTTGRAGDKFGVPVDEAQSLCTDYLGHAWVSVIGFHMHLGSPIYTTEPYVEAIGVLRDLIAKVETLGCPITHLDLGGGFGADYVTNQTPSYQVFADAIIPAVRPLVDRGVQIALEPGRTIMGNAGVLVVSVRHVKHQAGRRFVICDAGMNALIRPSLYNAKHFVWPTTVDRGDVPHQRQFEDGPITEPCDIVGPVCESGDFLARGVRLPPVERGDRLAVFTAGAYGMTMASTYNDQPLPAEVLIDGDRVQLIRKSQQPEQTLNALENATTIVLPEGAFH